MYSLIIFFILIFILFNRIKKVSSLSKKKNDLKKTNINFKIKPFLTILDNGNIEILKTSINNINKNNSKKIDIPLEIYENGFLTSNRLNFIIKNCSDSLYISSSLLKKLIKNNEIQLLKIIFSKSKFYDNEFIKTLLYQYKYKTSIFVNDLNRIMSNDHYIISTNYSVEKFQDYYVEACGDGKKNIIKYLIGHGADVNGINQYNITPLCKACEEGNEKIVEYLIEHGADVNKVKLFNETPLHCACKKGNEKIAKYLIEHGANIKIVDVCGYSPFFMSCKSGNEHLVKYLVGLGADINEESNCGETPLFYACKSGNEDLVKYLVKLGADVKKINHEKETPLFRACESGNENLVKYLVELEVDIAIESIRGETALFKACRNGNEKIVKYLVEHGANINKENKWAETPLFFACKNRNKKIIKYLVEQGADINKVIDVINSPRRRHLWICGFYNKKNIKKYLVELKSNINSDRQYEKKICY